MKANIERIINTDIDGILRHHINNQKREDIIGKMIQKGGYNVTSPKVKLSSFNGENANGWLRKCRKFFKLNFISIKP